MGNLGVPELLIIVVLFLVFFGSKKIPEMAQGLGKGIKEFRKATREIQEDDEQESRKIEEGSRGKGDKATCFYCSSPIIPNAKFCPSCGKSLEPPRCPKCNTINTFGHRFCSECGEKLPV